MLVGGLLLTPLAGRAEADCTAQDIDLTYEDERVVLVFVLDVSDCRLPGTIVVQGQLSRNDLISGAVVRGIQNCDAFDPCRFSLSVPHPQIEALVDYAGEVSWSLTSKRRVMAGFAGLYMSCQLATPAARICI